MGELHGSQLVLALGYRTDCCMRVVCGLSELVTPHRGARFKDCASP